MIDVVEVRKQFPVLGMLGGIDKHMYSFNNRKTDSEAQENAYYS